MTTKENHILIGLGGTGGKVLKEFRKRLFKEYNEEERSQLPIGFVYVDSTNEMMTPGDATFKVLGQDASFDTNEFVNIKGIDLNAVFSNPSGFPGLSGFIGDPEVMQKTIGTVGAAAGQKRKAGRILFGASVQSFIDTLNTQNRKTNKISGKTVLNIHIITGLAGGTGSGSIIDVIAQTRKLFPHEIDSSRTSGTDIVAYAMVPELSPPSGCEAGRYHANGYAALMELNGLLSQKYIPHDVTGRADRLDFSTKKIANGCMLYSNVNEHGKILHSFDQLPTIISDFLFNRIFLETNKNTNAFMRSYSFENIDDYRYENNEKAKEGEIDIVRSKTFGSFGIKRVIIPEEEIIEYFTYNFGRQALLQIRYNNWNDDLGFRDAPANIDFHSFVKEAEQLERWRITDKHLMLDKPILDSDAKKWNSISDYWTSVIPIWAAEASKAKMPLNEMEKYCAEGYNTYFRKGGVKNFYEGKTQAKEQHASEICNIIEHYLFDKWKDGDFSLYNLCELTDKITEVVSQKRTAFESNISTYNQKIEELEKAKQLNQLEWSNKGLLGGLLFKNKMIQAHATILQLLFVRKTEIEGLQFGLSVLAVLRNMLNTMRTRIEKFVNTINDSLKTSEEQIGIRCTEGGSNINLQDSVISFYDRNAVIKFTKDVSHNKNRQTNIASEFRQELVNLIGSEQSFARANATINTEDISYLLDTLIRKKSIAIHDEILTEDCDKLINRNILEQLNEHFSSEEDLKTFAKKVIEESGVLINANPTELNRAVKNNPIPEKGISIFKKVIMINLPKVEGNEQVQKFAARLEKALLGAVQGDVHVYVDMSGSRKNEMTIASITYCFPIRALRDLPFLKEKYDYLVNNPNEARQNRTVLHTEGTGDTLPDLFVAKDMLPSDIRAKYTAYLMVAHSIGIIKYADKADGSGKSAFGIVEKNRLGLEVLNPFADTFTGIINSAKFNEEFGETLREKVRLALKNEYLHVDKRNELVTGIQELIVKIILPECGGNQGSQEFKFFSDRAEQALDLIEKS
ncbi:hypothetical protein AwDysgo_20190 [Bacteroidales bacterium]|nr:hypothetical protein AwDysgo_20190 [Bacteroidales bacterium]